MPSGLNSGQGSGITTAHGLAAVVLLAVIVLVVLRYFYGAIRIEGGVRL